MLRLLPKMIADFNSIKVQLEPSLLLIKSASSLDFNSIKVQLEPTAWCMPRKLPSFQFHKGTIRTVLLHAVGASGI